MIKDTEAEIKTKIKRYLKKILHSKFVSYSPTPYGEAGTPDIVGCVKGKMVLIEVKVEGKNLTGLQVLRRDEWLSAGAKVIVAHSVKELREQLNNII
jgi:hypothetical protein